MFHEANQEKLDANQEKKEFSLGTIEKFFDYEGKEVVFYKPDKFLSPFWHRAYKTINAQTFSESALPTKEQDNSEDAEFLRCYQSCLKEHFKREKKEQEQEKLEERQRKNKLDRQKRWAERDANPKPSNQKSKKKQK